MNGHIPMLPQVQPAVPLQNARHQPDVPYSPPQRSLHHPQLYHAYQNAYQNMSHSQHFQQQHPPQWYQYQQMPAQIPRPYPQYAPVMNVPYQMHQNHPPFAQRPVPPQNLPSSSSIQSHQVMLSPSSSNASLHVPTPGSLNLPNPYLAPPTPPPPPSRRIPYYPPLPWYSFTGGPFPSKGSRRRRKKPAPQSSNVPVQLPIRHDLPESELTVQESRPHSQDAKPAEDLELVGPNFETPLTSDGLSEDDSTQPTTPSSIVAPPMPQSQISPDFKSPSRPNSFALPFIPAIPLASKAPKRPSISTLSEVTKIQEPSKADQPGAAAKALNQSDSVSASNGPEPAVAPTSPPKKPAPKSWAELVRSSAQKSPQNGNTIQDNGIAQSNGFITSRTTSLAEALCAYRVDEIRDDTRVTFLQPRGLVNTGNMCYMNSVLQILVFCIPFYDFLERIGRQAVHTFKTETPLVDAMILFIREFPIIDSAVSVEKLRMRLKKSELDQYGEAFTPEFVYEVIRRLPRFASMQRGHQQDAEEFLGFLLEEMHDECTRAMRSSMASATSGASTPTNGVVSPTSESTESTKTGDHGWFEVGPKQKSAITRSSGAITTESPITKIFGGKLRSELRVPGMKHSVTLEPYQPLQLDIGAPHVNNIIEALKGLTHSEILHGDFNSPRGPGISATKQVTIESLPQVLILHLKRFQYDNAGGTQKIWKKIGYPLELEIPKEVFPQHRRGALLAHGGLPKYSLIGVVYHHGKNASGGHYTVDVRRQDGREWIRLDDTVIRRVRSEDVAEGGSEEDPKVLAAALEQHKTDQVVSGNVYDQFTSNGTEQAQSEDGWNRVNSVASGNFVASKKWSGVANGTATPIDSSGKMSPSGRSSIKDNKVAYLLFYQKIKS